MILFNWHFLKAGHLCDIPTPIDLFRNTPSFNLCISSSVYFVVESWYDWQHWPSIQRLPRQPRKLQEPVRNNLHPFLLCSKCYFENRGSEVILREKSSRCVYIGTSSNSHNSLIIQNNHQSAFQYNLEFIILLAQSFSTLNQYLIQPLYIKLLTSSYFLLPARSSATARCVSHSPRFSFALL